jgi:hypothetical protein
LAEFLLTPLRSESCNDDWIPRERATASLSDRTVRPATPWPRS